MALYPLMLFKYPHLKNEPSVIRHEQIHFRQQIELLILPFYILYLLNYLFNLLKYQNHDKAYLHICFEKEAYANDKNPDYLKTRKPYSWLIVR